MNPPKSVLQRATENVVAIAVIIGICDAVLSVVANTTDLISTKWALILTAAVLIISLLYLLYKKYIGISWVYGNTLVRYKQWSLKDWHVLIGAVVTIWLGPVINALKSEKSTNDFNKINYQLACNFPELYNRDTLYILVTRFESDVNKIETGCFGKALRDRIDEKANVLRIPIRICYSDSLYPQTHSEAKLFQKRYYADLVLWGNISSIKNDCSNGDFCFYSQPSDLLINTVTGKIEVETDITKYQKDISPEAIREGKFQAKFSLNDYNFDKWLLTIYNIKIGNIKPDLYAIDNTLDSISLSSEYYLRSALFMSLYKYDKAFEGFSKAINLNPNNADAYYGRGNIKYAIYRDSSSALIDFNKALLINPTLTDVFNVRGTIKFDNGDTLGALKDYNKAIQLDPKHANAYYNRGLSYLIMGKQKLALKDFNISIKYDSNNSSAYLNRGNLYLSIGEKVEALKDFNSSIRINPNDPSTHFRRGYLYYTLNRKADALKDFDYTISLDPNNEDAYYNRGSIKNETNELSAALQDLTNAIQIKPNHKIAYLERGVVLSKLGRVNAAMDDYNMAVNLNPYNTLIYNNRATLKYKSLHDTLGALRDYNNALLIDPNSQIAIINIGNILLTLGDRNNALEFYKRLLVLSPDNIEAHQKISYINWLNSQKK